MTARRFPCFLIVRRLTACAMAIIVLAAVPHPAHAALRYLDNGVIRVGVDLVRGGAIGYLSRSAVDDNVVNIHDCGRYIQQSYYAGPHPYLPPNTIQHPSYAGWGWNPVQAGDVYNANGQVLEESNDGSTQYVKARPKQWALRNVNADCTVEAWITLDANRVHVRNRLVNARADTTSYPGQHQELPAIYTIGRLYRLFSYTGAEPFTGDALTQITNSGPPWAYWSATENWSALVDTNNWGLGIFHAGATLTVGGFHGTPGLGGPLNNDTGYLSPLHTEVLDQNIVYEVEYTLVLGDLESDIRTWAVAHAPTPGPSCVFSGGRAHCVALNLSDAPAPFDGYWPLTLDSADPQILLPPSLWQAEDVPCVLVTGAWRTQGAMAEIFFAGANGAFSGDRRLDVPIIPDGQMRTYRVDLSEHPLYTGPISRLRLDPIVSRAAGDAVDLYAITTASTATVPDVPRASAVVTLDPAVPNPFNPRTALRFSLRDPARVTAAIYDTRGRLVRRIADAEAEAGAHEYVWDGCDGSGRAVPSGTYFFRVTAGAETALGKMQLVR